MGRGANKEMARMEEDEREIRRQEREQEPNGRKKEMEEDENEDDYKVGPSTKRRRKGEEGERSEVERARNESN